MSFQAEEEEWRQQRKELYEHLRSCGRKGLRRDAVLSARDGLVIGNDNTLALRPMNFKHADDAINLIAIHLPPSFQKKCRDIAEFVAAPLLQAQGDGPPLVYVNEEESMHITLFHTSAPGCLITNARQHQPQEIDTLRKLFATIPSFDVTPFQVALADSGAITLQYEGVRKEDRNELDWSTDCSVDHVRRLAKATFPYGPQNGTKTIIHTTLARIIDPDVPMDTLRLVHEACDQITKELKSLASAVHIQEIWYIDETHMLSAVGNRTTFSLKPPSN